MEGKSFSLLREFRIWKARRNQIHSYNIERYLDAPVLYRGELYRVLDFKLRDPLFVLVIRRLNERGKVFGPRLVVNASELTQTKEDTKA